MNSLSATLRRGRHTIVAGLLALTLASCGSKDQGAAVSGQVVAHVGDEVITKQELDNEFRLNNVPAEKQKDPALIKQVLGELVQRKYLLQQAIKDKLDREPGVLLDLLRAREQVLANAYIARAISSKPIEQADIDSYIANNPLKFANRQILASDQLTFPLGPNAQAIIDQNKDSKDLEEVDERLTSMGIPHGRSTGSVSSAEIPQDFFNTIQAKKADNVFFAKSGNSGVFFVVKGQETRPLAGEPAFNLARQLLRADRAKAETELASFSGNLETKYEGSYAALMAAGQPAKN